MMIAANTRPNATARAGDEHGPDRQPGHRERLLEPEDAGKHLVLDRIAAGSSARRIDDRQPGPADDDSTARGRRRGQATQP